MIDSESFFNAPGGKSDPAAELAATLRAFFARSHGVGEQHPQCAFVARYRWLKRELDFDPERLPEHACPRFVAWSGAIDANQVTLIFPSAYLNNPSSMFGHTLLRLDRAGQDEQTRLLSYAINYGAVTGNDGGLMFAVRGLTGGYRGTYSIMPYYTMVQRYRDFENRDIWEYQLDLEPDEIDRLVAHLWELREQHADYFFFDENCSYQLLLLLEAARPSLELADAFPLHAIPVDTVRTVVAQEGLLKQTTFRPSSRTVIEQRLRLLSADESRLVQRLAAGEMATDDPELGRLAASRRAAVLELAAEFVTYRLRSGDQPRVEAAPLAWQLLAARSQLGSEAVPPPAARHAVRPDRGHKSARLAGGFGARDGRSFASLKLRPAYHDLSDADDGYVEGAAIDFLDGEFRFYEGDNAPALESLTLVGIRSLSPRNPLFRPLSWRLGGGLDRFRAEGEGEQGALVAAFWGGAGLTYQLGKGALASVMAEVELGVGDDCPRTCFASLGPAMTLIWPATERFRLLLDGRLHALFRDRVGERYAIDLTPSYALERNLALKANLLLEDDGGGAQVEWSAALHWYF